MRRLRNSAEDVARVPLESRPPQRRPTGPRPTLRDTARDARARHAGTSRAPSRPTTATVGARRNRPGGHRCHGCAALPRFSQRKAQRLRAKGNASVAPGDPSTPDDDLPHRVTPRSADSFLPSGNRRPVDIDRKRQNQCRRPDIRRCKQERLLIPDQIGDKPDDKPQQRHRPTTSSSSGNAAPLGVGQTRRGTRCQAPTRTMFLAASCSHLCAPRANSHQEKPRFRAENRASGQALGHTTRPGSRGPPGFCSSYFPLAGNCGAHGCRPWPEEPRIDTLGSSHDQGQTPWNGSS